VIELLEILYLNTSRVSRPRGSTSVGRDEQVRQGAHALSWAQPVANLPPIPDLREGPKRLGVDYALGACYQESKNM